MTPYHCLDCRFCQIRPEPHGGLHYLCQLLLKTFSSCEVVRQKACPDFQPAER